MRAAIVLVFLVACGRVGFDETAAFEVTRLQLYSSNTDIVLGEITEGSSLDVSGSPNGVGVLIHIAGNPGSVRLTRNGTSSVRTVEPFASGGATGADYERDGMLRVGLNALTITPYEHDDETGQSGPTVTINFELTLVIDGTPTINRAVLLDEAGSMPNMPLDPGGVYAVGSLPAAADIRVITTPGFVGSVRFSGVGPWDRTENWVPYVVMGSDSFTPTTGTYTLVTTAYPLGDLLGTPGPTTSLTFQIVP